MSRETGLMLSTVCAGVGEDYHVVLHQGTKELKSNKLYSGERDPVREKQLKEGKGDKIIKNDMQTGQGERKEWSR